jgi:hypothetical protein
MSALTAILTILAVGLPIGWAIYKKVNRWQKAKKLARTEKEAEDAIFSGDTNTVTGILDDLLHPK